MKKLYEIKIQSADMTELSEGDTEAMRRRLQKLTTKVFGKETKVLFVTKEKK